jgi:hypothetical protein
LLQQLTPFSSNITVEIRMTTIRLLLVIAVLVAIAPVTLAQEAEDSAQKLPLSTANYDAAVRQEPLTIPQQRARFASDQRMMRLEFNNWIGYSPLRPNVNSSYMSAGYPRYYIPSRNVIVSTGPTRAWFW